MVKTTTNPEDEIYAETIKESMEKYGSTKNMSKIINPRLRKKKSYLHRSAESVLLSRQKKLCHLWMQTMR